MRLFLLGCIALFVVVIILAAIKTRNSGINATRNRKREHKKMTRSLSSKPLEKLFEESINAEEGVQELLDSDAELDLEPTFEVESVSTTRSKPAAESHKQPVTASKLQYAVLHIMAPHNSYYKGYELLQALLANGMRYGKDKIFHRHEQKSGLGKILFSMTSVNRPGTFDLPNMANFSCPGLTLFLVMHEVADPRKAFDLMFETAQQIVEDIGGELWDEHRKPLTMDMVSKLRSEIERSYDTSRTPDLFERA